MKEIREMPECLRVPNVMVDVAGFINACVNAYHDRNVKKHHLYVTASGSINRDGRECSFSATSLTPHHPQFEQSLEPGIRQLVQELFRARYLPYTSCEGHLIEGIVYEAHVGLIVNENFLSDLNMTMVDALACAGFKLFSHTLWDPKSQFSHKTIELYLLHNAHKHYQAYRETVSRSVSAACDILESVGGK